VKRHHRQYRYRERIIPLRDAKKTTNSTLASRGAFGQSQKDRAIDGKAVARFYFRARKNSGDIRHEGSTGLWSAVILTGKGQGVAALNFKRFAEIDASIGTALGRKLYLAACVPRWSFPFDHPNGETPGLSVCFLTE